jgi:hypothetical protein
MFEVLVLNTGLVSAETANSDDSLLRSQKPGVDRRVREDEPVTEN